MGHPALVVWVRITGAGVWRSGVWRSPPLLRFSIWGGTLPMGCGVPAMPQVRLLPTLDHAMVVPSDGGAPYIRPRTGGAPLPRGCTPSPHPPVACAVAASKRSSCSRRPSSRIAERSSVFARAHADDRRRDTRKDRVHDGHTSRAAACSPTRRCSRLQSRPRRLVRQAPRTASLALTGAPTAVTSGRRCAR